MQDWFVTDGIDEQRVLQDARSKSEGDYYDKPEAVQIHYHSGKVQCDASQRHAIYKDGFAVEGGGGQA
jgi:hypothetical protein